MVSFDMWAERCIRRLERIFVFDGWFCFTTQRWAKSKPDGDMNMQEDSLALFTDNFVSVLLEKVMNVGCSGHFGWCQTGVVDPGI
jgi:hypothetical protein